MKRADLMRWTIDVCATCGAHATYPFCEHRVEHYGLAAEGLRLWTIPVVVKAAYPTDLWKALGRDEVASS